jgi:RES domain-containing protein
VRFRGTAYRAHDPRWSFKPLSGYGAALYGGRYNRKGKPALYLALDAITAVREITQGLARKFDPCVLCSYVVDCEPLADLRTDAGRARHHVKLSDMRCAWFLDAAANGEPASWMIADRLIAEGYAGLLTSSFAPGATRDAHNLVLWRWGAELPTKIAVYDPSGKLPKDQLSWP